mmetsp:Transcript_3871/g.9869  ORF Transcript_3871/g.9869 Transcript_3871/m.9869 type:complete len:202 (-) Transcript_3871:377-982(-)
MRRSSCLMVHKCARSLSLSVTSVPKWLIPVNVHMLSRWTLLRLSRVNSSLKSLANREISSFVTASPLRIFWMNFFNSSAFVATFPVRFLLTSEAIWSTVSCKKEATSSLSRSFLFLSSSRLSLSWKVDGSMLGNIANATGRSSSMNGTTKKMSIGTIRKMSAVVRVIWLRSRLLSVFPPSAFPRYLDAILTSVQSSLVPAQ